MSGTLGERIRELRESRGWDVQMLADKSGMHLTSIYMFEKGQRTRLQPESLQRLARAFGISVSALLGESASEDPPEVEQLLPYRPAIVAAKSAGMSPDALLKLIQHIAALQQNKEPGGSD